MRLKNKIAIITGSASGFGKGIAKKFTEEGANLILVDVNTKLLKEVSKNLSQDYFVADVSKDSNFKSLFFIGVVVVPYLRYKPYSPLFR